MSAPIGPWTGRAWLPLTGQKEASPAYAVPGFVAPTLVPSISFGPLALAGAIARTATLLDATPAYLMAKKKSVVADLRYLVGSTHAFSLTANVTTLADSERGFLGERLGTGITHLYMDALHYAWRDNAAKALPSAKLNPHADFVYAGGAADGHGVVLAEARGSTLDKLSEKTVARWASNKYGRQVKPHLGKTSIHGPVIHGYSIAFGASPVIGAGGPFLRLEQTRQPKKAGPSSTPGQPSPSIVLATHRSNFILLGTLRVVRAIDALRDGTPLEGEEMSFMSFEYNGRRFVVPDDVSEEGELLNFPWLFRPWPYWSELADTGFAIFAMEEAAALAFLDQLSARLREREAAVRPFELPLSQPYGFGLGDDVTDRGAFAVFRDGMALMPVPRRAGDIRRLVWSSATGVTRP